MSLPPAEKAKLEKLYGYYFVCFLVLAVINSLIFAYTTYPMFLGFTISSCLGAFVTKTVQKFWRK